MSGWERGTGSQCLPCRISLSPSKGTVGYLCCWTALQFLSFPSSVQQTSEKYAILNSTLSCPHRNIVMWCDPLSRRIGVNECQISAGQCAVFPPEGPWFGDPARASAPSPAEQGGRLEAAPWAAARKDRRVLKAFCSFETSGCYFSLLLDLTIPMDWEASVAKLVLCLWNGTQVSSQHPGAGARSTAGLVLAGMMMLTSLGQRRTEKGQSIKLHCFSMVEPSTSELNSMYN